MVPKASHDDRHSVPGIVSRLGLSSPSIRRLIRDWYRSEPAGTQNTSIPSGKTGDDLRRLGIKLGMEPSAIEPARLLAVLRHVLAFVTKLLAFRAVVGAKAFWHTANDLCSWRWFNALDSGAVFESHGISGLVPAECSGHLTERWNARLAFSLEQLIQELSQCSGELCDGGVESSLSLHHLHAGFLPRRLRRQLGEYYTPPWLAEHVLQQTCSNDIDEHILDPACGAGVFLALAIRRKLTQYASAGMNDREKLNAVLKSVSGMDVDPLAVLFSRTSFLLALGRLRSSAQGGLILPVECRDCVLDPGQQSVDVIVGNPPWIGWETLSKEYRQQTLPLWMAYGLFPHRGMDSILGKGKKDLSFLLSYRVTDCLLRVGGRLGFVITQSAFKTSAAAQGFRRFAMDEFPDGAIGVTAVDDFTAIQPFGGASTRTAVVYWTKGIPTSYPVEYRIWRSQPLAKTSDPEITPAKEIESLSVRVLSASPVDPRDRTSPWFVSRCAASIFRKMTGPSAYQAREGANTGGANSVYWLEILERKADQLKVRNVVHGAKHAVEQISPWLEAELIFPLLRGSDLKNNTCEPTCQILMVQDAKNRRGYDESILQAKWPLTWKYLRGFESQLRKRSAYRRYFVRPETSSRGGPAFYSMFNIGEYTFAEHKVVWHRMRTPMLAWPLETWEGRPIIPQETLAFVACQSREEACFLSAMLNSTPFRWALEAFSQVGSKGFATPSILSRIRIPKFDANNSDHVNLARLALEMRQQKTPPIPRKRAELENSHSESNRLAARIWGLTSTELSELESELADWKKV